MLNSAKLRREILRLYDKDPQGWSVLVGRDKTGFFDAIISHGTETWQIKEYEVNPYKFVGLGAKLANVSPPSLGREKYPFGLRPMNQAQIKEIANLIDNPVAMSELASKLLDEKPVSSREAAESVAVLQGPIFHSTKPLEALSSAQGRLDADLRRELRRIVNREFRHTLTPYL